MTPQPPMPLAGIRVLDFSWVLAGPIGARILANFGADVFKVESSRRMDPVRFGPLPRGLVDPNLGGWFNGANTGKRSLVLNLDTDRGRTLARRMAVACDVVVENFRPGVLDRLGMPYDELRVENPGIVVVHLPGCAPPGPWADKATFGNILAAAIGLNWLSGFEDAPPSGIGIALPDFVSPYLLVSAVAAALRERATTGTGREITIDQLQASLSLIGPEWMRFARDGGAPARNANRDPNFCPHGVYRCNGDDQWVAIAVESDEEWRAFCDEARRPELGADPRFATHAGRKRNEDAVDEAVAEYAARHDKWTSADRLQSRGIAAAAVEDVVDSTTREPSAAHFQRVVQPTSPDHEILVDGEPITYRGRPRELRRAPMLFEHTEDVLREVLGIEGEEFAELIECGAIG